jgi:hypothetical protein
MLIPSIVGGVQWLWPRDEGYSKALVGECLDQGDGEVVSTPSLRDCLNRPWAYLESHGFCEVQPYACEDEASKGKPLFVDGEQLGEGVVRLRNGKFLDPSGTVMSEGEIRELRRVIGASRKGVPAP